MPAFGEALTNDQIDKVVEYLRGFCRDSSWPRAELNLPRALFTEKAYPEDEVVMTTTLNAQGAPGVENHIVYEQRFGVKNQIEIDLPFTFENQNRTWYGGVGDTALGWKRELFSSLRTGSIFSLQGEAILPLGDKWAMKLKGSERTWEFDTQAEALAVAREAAQSVWRDKGLHSVVMIQQPDGQWLQDAKQGETPMPPSRSSK